LHSLKNTIEVKILYCSIWKCNKRTSTPIRKFQSANVINRKIDQDCTARVLCSSRIRSRHLNIDQDKCRSIWKKVLQLQWCHTLEQSSLWGKKTHCIISSFWNKRWVKAVSFISIFCLLVVWCCAVNCHSFTRPSWKPVNSWWG
jgi:hypothetical protein